MGRSTIQKVRELVIQSSLMPPLLFGPLLRKDPVVRVHDDHWSHHRSMIAPIQIPSLWHRRERGEYCDSISETITPRVKMILTFVQLRRLPRASLARQASAFPVRSLQAGGLYRWRRHGSPCATTSKQRDQINMVSHTHVENTARLDYIYRWAIFVDTTKDGTTTERPYGRVEGIRLYIKAYTIRQCLHHKVVDVDNLTVRMRPTLRGDGSR